MQCRTAKSCGMSGYALKCALVAGVGGPKQGFRGFLVVFEIPVNGFDICVHTISFQSSPTVRRYRLKEGSSILKSLKRWENPFPRTGSAHLRLTKYYQ